VLNIDAKKLSELPLSEGNHRLLIKNTAPQVPKPLLIEALG